MRSLTKEAFEEFSKRLNHISAALHLPFEQMKSLRFLYGNLFRHLTGDEPVFFASDYERMIFLSNRIEIPEARQKSLRTLGYQLQHFQDEQFEWKDELYQESYKRFREWLDFLSQDPPQKEAVSELKINPADVPVGEFSLLDAIVLEKGKKVKKEEGGGFYFFVQCHSPSVGDFEVLFWNEFEYLFNCIWQGVRINLIRFQKEEKYFQNRDSEFPLFSPAASAQVVVDPDYLLTATNISHSFLRGGPHPFIYVINKFERLSPNKYFFRGSIMNDYFDQLMAGKPVKIQDLIDQYFSKNPILALVFKQEEIQEVKAELPTHISTVNRREVQQYRKETLHFEPTFISEVYGLRGRLDMMVEYKETTSRRDVVELKTSKDPHRYGKPVNDDNAAQATCYNLLLDLKGMDLRGGSAILYSSAAPHLNPLRNVPNDAHSHRAVLQLRNLIIGEEYFLLHWPQKALERIRHTSLQHINMWDNDRKLIVHFEESLKSATELERAWFFEFTRFIARERRAAKIGPNTANGRRGFSFLWNEKNVDQKLDAYAMISHLVFDKFIEGEKGSELVFQRDKAKREITVYRAGDFVLLYPQKKETEVQATQYQIVKAAIKSISEDELTLLPLNPHIDEDYLKTSKFWAIETEFMDMGNDAMFEGIYDFLQCTDKRARGLIMGQLEPAFSEKQSTENFSEQLLPIQKEMVARALSAEDYFLLQGPPGTGKTNRVLREMVMRLMEDPTERILLLAFTNRAVDEICKMLQGIEGLPEFSRLGHGTSTEMPETLLGRKLHKKKLSQMRREIFDTRIFVSTVLSAQRKSELYRISKFSTVIVDEASQLLEPQLAGILPHFPRFILIGDEKQLPAVVIQSEEMISPSRNELPDNGFFDLRISLFERLIGQCKRKGWNGAYGSLLNQGRMHEEIMQFPSEAFYAGKLTVISDNQKRKIPAYLEGKSNPLFDRMKKGRVHFLSSESEPHRSYHLAEAEKVAELCEQLSSLFPMEEWPESIGVICPYRAQIAEVKKRLSPDLRKSITVDTVERFQGSQRKVILYTMAVNSPLEMVFLENLNLEKNVDRKLNVAITRAQDFCFILACPSVLSQGIVHPRLLQYLQDKEMQLS